MKTRAGFFSLLAFLVVVSVTLLGSGIYLAAHTIEVTNTDEQGPTVEVDGTLQGFYNQPVEWRPCGPEDITPFYSTPPKNLTPYECASILAPLDWDNLAGDTISLSVAVHRSGNDNAPVLFFNLGGPGGPAVSSLSTQVRDSMGGALVDAYDIVAMDPRGVGESTPVQCLTDHEKDNMNAWGVISDADVEKVKERAASETKLSPEDEIREAQEIMVQYAKGCEKHTGDLAAHIDTPSVARDFDMLRELMGQEKFNYLGYSYGTFLGATYAELFPSAVGRMVLDAAVDPAMQLSEISSLQMKGFDASLKHWIEDCQAGPSCPLPGDVREGVTRIKGFLKRLETQPMPTADPDRPLTQQLALGAMIGMMYDEQGYAPLTQGIGQALSQNDGSILLRLADFLSGRQDDGTFASNSSEALVAVNLLDFPVDGTAKDWIPQVMQLRSELDIMDEFVGYDSAGLAVWPFRQDVQRKPVTAEGAAPIVVIGQTNDPATPYVMSQNLARQLRSGVLVTQEGWSHGAYSKTAGTCVVDAVEHYLVDGQVPQDGLVCQ